MCQWVETVGCGFVVVGLLGWSSSERLGSVMAAVLWWVQIGVDVRVEVQIRVARVVGFGYGFVAVLWWVLAAVCAVDFFFFGGWWWWLWLWPWLEVMSLKSSSHGSFERKISEKGGSF